MATWKSQAYIGGVKYRPVREGLFEVSSTIKIPAGRTIGDGDILKFFKLGANVDVVSYILRVSDLDDGATFTLDFGTSEDADCFLAASTLAQAGGVVQAFNGTASGDDVEFAESPYVVQTSAVDVQITLNGAATQSTVDDNDRYVTVSMVLAPTSSFLRPNDDQEPYDYAFDY